MSRKRSNIEISADILRVALTGAKKSHIVYKANLNFKIVRKYMDRLRESGLLAGPTFRDKVYQTTEEGIEYLHRYDEFRDYMQSTGVTPEYESFVS